MSLRLLYLIFRQVLGLVLRRRLAGSPHPERIFDAVRAVVAQTGP